MRWLANVVPWMAMVASGCGRVGFDPLAEGSLDPDGAALDGTACDEIIGAMLCESFEGPAMLASTQGMAAVDEIHPYRGQRSLRTSTTGPNQMAWQVGGVLDYRMTGDLYARWYQYIPSSIAIPQMASVHLVEATMPYDGVVFGIHDGTLSVSTTGTEGVSDIEPERDRWLCIQLHVSISQTAGVVESWIDGVPGARVDNSDTLPATGYRNVHAGMYASGLAAEPQELWTDELVVGGSPIPCD